MSNQSPKPKPSGEELFLVVLSWAMVVATFMIAFGYRPGLPSLGRLPSHAPPELGEGGGPE
jgi:hypothetical protein